VIAARKLLRRTHRQHRSALLIEGGRAIAEALGSGARMEEIFVSESASDADAIVAEAAERGVEIVWATDGVLATLSDATTPQGIVGVARSPLVDLGVLDAGDLVVVLAEVRDPGNAGTLLRSAAAAGARAVIFTDGSVDPLNPKTVRAAAGTLFALPVSSGARLEDAVALLRARGLVIVGASARADHAAYDLDLARPTAFILGNESWGLPAEQRRLLDEEVGIPMPGPAESLNVGIAGSILLFEAARQRRVEQALAGLSSAPRTDPPLSRDEG
jgi:RNA methyltransferase, TrmH family